MVDLTESRPLEQETLRAQKMESIGVLAAGIAHDFNNLLGIIMGNISLATLYHRSGRDHSHLLVQAEKACLQAKGLTEELLNLAKGGEPYKQTVSLREILSEAVDLTTDTSNIRCYFEIPENLWPIWCDPSQVRQVILNLLANASEAMPGGGTVRIEAWNEEILDDTSLLRAGRYVKFSVKDCGVGIPEADKPKVFDPYFSTKTRGAQKGMGLGLSLAYWVIRRHGGHIEMESIAGEGTRFDIVLPAAEIREPQMPQAVGQAIHRLG